MQPYYYIQDNGFFILHNGDNIISGENLFESIKKRATVEFSNPSGEAFWGSLDKAIIYSIQDFYCTASCPYELDGNWYIDVSVPVSKDGSIKKRFIKAIQIPAPPIKVKELRPKDLF